jgi:hypothetical protein
VKGSFLDPIPKEQSFRRSSVQIVDKLFVDDAIDPLYSRRFVTAEFSPLFVILDFAFRHAWKMRYGLACSVAD